MPPFQIPSATLTEGLVYGLGLRTKNDTPYDTVSAAIHMRAGTESKRYTAAVPLC